jgi:hypothetical protein
MNEKYSYGNFTIQEFTTIAGVINYPLLSMLLAAFGIKPQRISIKKIK